jgi:hypothetical protein
MRHPDLRCRVCPGRVPRAVTRREVLQRSSAGFGLLTLSGLMAEPAYAGLVPEGAPAARGPHHPPRARNVIFLFMDGGPSQVDTFDPKPELARHEGSPIGLAAASKRSQSNATRVWFPSPWQFAQHGQSGLWVSNLLPHIARCADRLCVVHSMVGELPLHGQQNLLLHTGRVIGQAPSLGAWVSYGLGTENHNLPGYVLLNNDWVPNGGLENFSSSFLPATHQATILRARGVPMDNLAPRDDRAVQRRTLELLAGQDAAFAVQSSDAATIEAAIENYETAFLMQSLVSALTNIDGEPPYIRRMYGVDAPDDYQKFYAIQCLRARRLVEAGVRFIEVTCPLFAPLNAPWDQHTNLKKHHEVNARVTDQAVAALIRDLDQRGLLAETIVLWAGEMGRTPNTAKISDTCGRDHHVDGYSIFLAGGGFQGGLAFGRTDDFGNAVVEQPLTIHDIHATILHQLGLDHRRLTYRFGGRDVRLTDVYGRVVKELLA